MPYFIIRLLCAIGIHRYRQTVIPGLEVCRYCYKRKY